MQTYNTMLLWENQEEWLRYATDVVGECRHTNMSSDAILNKALSFDFQFDIIPQ